MFGERPSRSAADTAKDACHSAHRSAMGAGAPRCRRGEFSKKRPGDGQYARCAERRPRPRAGRQAPPWHTVRGTRRPGSQRSGVCSHRRLLLLDALDRARKDLVECLVKLLHEARPAGAPGRACTQRTVSVFSGISRGVQAHAGERSVGRGRAQPRARESRARSSPRVGTVGQDARRCRAGGSCTIDDHTGHLRPCAGHPPRPPRRGCAPPLQHLSERSGYIHGLISK